MSTTLHSTEALLSQVSWLRALALELVQDRGEAEDLAQETILRALEHPPRAAGAMRGFLRRISHNLARDRARADVRRQDREVLAARGEAVSPTDDVVDRLHAHRRLVEAIERLEEPYRATILLRYFDGLAPREIAQLQCAPVKTVNTRLQRGIEQLRAELDRRANGSRRQWALALLPFLEPIERSIAPVGAPFGASVKPFALAAAGLAVIAAGALAWMGQASDEPSTPAETIVATADEVKSLASALEEPRDAPARAVVSPAVPADHATKLTGRVVNADGSAVARASVSVSFRPSAGIQERRGEFSKAIVPIATASSTEDGRFEIDVPGDASYRLEARAPGLGTEIQDDVIGGDDVVLELKRAGGFEFTVLHDEGETPCANASLRLSRTGIAGSIYEGETNADGRARIDALAPGVYLVEVTPRAAERAFTIDLVLQAGERLQHTLRAKSGQVIHGIVRSAADGTPIAGARVVHLPTRVATTDAAGRFELPGFPSSQTRLALEVEADGFAPTSARLNLKSADPVELTLGLEARVSGRVVGADGTPAASAWVLVDDRETRTEPDGSFVVRGLAPMRAPNYFVRAVGDASLAAVAPKELVAGDNDWGTIVLEKPASIAGRVLLPDGRPLVNATVTLKSRDGLAMGNAAPTLIEGRMLVDETTAVADVSSLGRVQPARGTDFFGTPRPRDASPLRDRTARTNAAGRFRMFDLPSGSYQITARGQGHAVTAPFELDLAAGEERENIELAVARGSSIAGRVRADDGTPIAGARVVLKETNGKTVGVDSLTALDGSFTLHGLASGTYELEVTFRGLVARRAYTDARILDLAPPVRDLDVRLSPLEFIEGVLVDEADRPIADVYVRATDTEWRRVSAATDERGRFRLGVVEGRTANLDVQGPVERRGIRGNSKVDPLWKGELAGVAAGSRGVVLRATRVE